VSVDEFDKVGNFLSRWSRRKLEQVKPAAEPPAQPGIESLPATPQENAGTQQCASPVELPPVESLTPESDFKPFMQPDVDSGVKRAALKQLFKDPHFNVMDGLDTYIEDYSVEDPIPEAMMKTMYQARQHLFSEEEKTAADAADAAEVAAAVDAAEAQARATGLAPPVEPGVPAEYTLPDAKDA